MATALNVRHQTLEDFLTWEREQPQRYERVSGVIRMMTGGTVDHNRITLNVAEAFRRRLRDGNCEAFVNDVKVVTPAGDVMYPYVVVACGDIAGKATVLEAPVVIVEVLSESTAERDHGRKRWAYQTIPSLRHYILIDQDEGGIEVTSPNADGTWQSVILRDLSDRLELTALKVEIGLEEVFARVAFPGAAARSGAADAS
ncbi:MAG: Uma2 family endonuclease [Geminicoccaceae bacterium]